MSYDIIFLLEEPSTKTVLDNILPQLIPEHIFYRCIPHEGKQDLEKSIPTKIQAFRFSPDTKFVIVHDQDSHDCKALKSKLQKLCTEAGKPDTLIRIICHELEAWFLGDLAAVEKGYGLRPKSLSVKQMQNKFRNPDRLNSAKEELRKLVSEYYPGTHSKAIAPHLSLTSNTSESFHTFLSGIEKIFR